MSAEHLTHATITKAGEVDFPLWVKAVAGMITVLMPLAIGAALWQGNQIFDISIRMARMEAALSEATADKQSGATALAKVMVIESRMSRLERDVDFQRDDMRRAEPQN